MEYIKTRTIMTKSNKGSHWFGIDYHMNLYKGCNFGCVYCDNMSDTYHIKDFSKIKVKENALKILENELVSKNNKGVISFGSLSDPYNKLEKDLELTRSALKLINKHGFGVSIDTKSDLILRDIDILKEISKNNNVIIKISLCTTSENLSRKLEPNAPSINKRLNTLKVLHENGIYAGILLMPILPFITDNVDNIKSCVRAAYENKAKFIYTKMGLTLRKGNKECYYKYLDDFYPGLKLDYEKVYEKSTFLSPLMYKNLLETFVSLCNEYHLLCDMTEIIKAYKKNIPSTKQISLF